jgi:hypothetical protein
VMLGATLDVVVLAGIGEHPGSTPGLRVTLSGGRSSDTPRRDGLDAAFGTAVFGLIGAAHAAEGAAGTAGRAAARRLPRVSGRLCCCRATRTAATRPRRIWRVRGQPRPSSPTSPASGIGTPGRASKRTQAGSASRFDSQMCGMGMPTFSAGSRSVRIIRSRCSASSRRR